MYIVSDCFTMHEALEKYTKLQRHIPTYAFTDTYLLPHNIVIELNSK